MADSTSWASFARGAPRSAPITGRAGSIVSTDSATSDIISATSATNSREPGDAWFCEAFKRPTPASKVASLHRRGGRGKAARQRGWPSGRACAMVPCKRAQGGRLMEALKIAPNLELPAAELERMYADMVRIRSFEERVIEQFQAGAVKGTAHSYIGEEAIAVGTCAHLREDDYVASYHRGHGHCIAKGARTDRMMAELMGRETGYCRGLGGSMHVADLDLNILGANGIVGAAMPLSVGAALAVKLRGGDQVVVAFFGDGANNQGIFHEIAEPRDGLAAAGDLRLREQPVRAQHLLPADDRDRIGRRARRRLRHPGRAHRRQRRARGARRARRRAVARARGGDGPSLVEAMTWRWGQHSMRANLRDPRSDEQMDDVEGARPDRADAGHALRARGGRGRPSSTRSRRRRARSSTARSPSRARARSPARSCSQTAVYAPHARHVEPAAARRPRADLRPGAERGDGAGDGARSRASS